MPPVLIGTLLFGWLALSAAGAGHRLLRWMGVQPTGRLERAVLAVGLGVGILQALPFALFVLHAGYTVVFRTAAVVLFLLLAPDWLAVLRGAFARPNSQDLPLTPSLRRRGNSLPLRRGGSGRGSVSCAKSDGSDRAENSETRAWWWVVPAAAACAWAAIYLRALCPPTDIDGLSYHLPTAIRTLHAHGFALLPTFTFSNWPWEVESLFALLLALHPIAPAGIVQALFGAVLMGATYLQGRLVGGRATGLAALVLLMVYLVFWEEMSEAHVDLGTTLFATLSVLALRRRWIVLSAVLAGLAATTKLNGLYVIVAMCAVYAPVAAQEAGSPAQIVRRVLRYGLGAFAVVLPWFLKTWVLTGNPVWPLAYRLFDGKEWTAEGWPRMQYYYLLLNTLPGLPITRGALLGIRLALVGVGVAITAAVWRATRRSALAEMGRFAALFTTLAWFGSGFILRFLLPIYPCVAVCAAAALRRRERKWMPALAVAAILLSARIVVRAGAPDLATAVRTALGIMGRDAYLERRLPDYLVVEFADVHLPPDSRLLVGTWDESSAYYRSMAYRCTYWLQDSVHYDSQAHLLADLRRLGVTHLVLKPMDEPWCQKSIACRARRRDESVSLSQLASEHGTPLFAANGYTLYRLSLLVH